MADVDTVFQVARRLYDEDRTDQLNAFMANLAASDIDLWRGVFKRMCAYVRLLDEYAAARQKG